MKIAITVVRILLGLIFAVFGLNEFLLFMPAPPVVPQSAGAFSTLIFSTHFMYLVAATQLLSGVFLLIDRYVPLALVILGAVIANILTFHITMWPQTLVPMPLVVFVLWLVLAWHYRAYLAPIFTAKA